MSILGIDISKHNGTVDFSAVKAAGASFVIIRTGYGDSLNNPNQVDPKFVQNINGAKAVGLNVGAYHFSYANSVSAAEQEANSMLDIIGNYKLEYPLYFDYEYASDNLGGHPGKTELTNRAIAFMDTLENAGYYPGVYMNRDFYVNRYNMSSLSSYDLWLSDPSNQNPTYSCRLHQTGIGDTGSTWPGVSGYCDTDSAYFDYPNTIKSLLMNGYTTEVISDTTMDINLAVGDTYTLKTTAPAKPTVTAGTGGVVNIDHSYRSGNDDFWPITAIGQPGQSTGIYTQGRNEEPIRRFIVNVV